MISNGGNFNAKITRNAKYILNLNILGTRAWPNYANNGPDYDKSEAPPTPGLVNIKTAWSEDCPGWWQQQKAIWCDELRFYLSCGLVLE